MQDRRDNPEKSIAETDAAPGEVEGTRRTIGVAIGTLFGLAAFGGVRNAALAQSMPAPGRGVADVLWADDLEDLRGFAMTTPYSVQVAVLKGFAAIGDGGEGVFVWDESSTAVDNDGIIVKPNNVTGNGRWRRMVDGAWNVAWFGAKGDGVTLNDAAFAKAISEMSAAGSRLGRYLYVPPGVYQFSATLHINKAVAIHGSSSNASTGDCSTQLRFPPGVHGIDISGPFQNQTGRGALIKDMRVTGQKRTSPVDLTHGIRMRCVAQLDNVYVEGFEGNGIDIYGNLETTGNFTNSSFWSIRSCQVASCGQHGVYVAGPDASAGTAVGLDVRDNGGWGVLDASFFGNTYIGAMSHGNALGSYRCESGANNKTVFLGCYSEAGQPNSQIGGDAMLIGGHHSSPVTGWQQQRGVISSVSVTPETGNNELRLGQAGSFVMFRNSAPTPQGQATDYGYFLKYVPAGTSWMADWYAFSFANGDTYPIAFSSPRSIEGAGHAWLPNGVFLGRGARIFLNSAWGRTNLPKKGRLGDVVINRYVGSGPDADIAQWHCVREGNGTSTIAGWRAVRLDMSGTEFPGVA